MSPPGSVMSEEAQAAAKVVADAAPHLAMGAAGVAAAVLRLATYSGPARPWRAVLVDGLVQSLVGYAIAALTLWWTGSVAASVGAGILSGLLGWEVVKRIACSRLQAPPR
jgi:hypothetical protein